MDGRRTTGSPVNSAWKDRCGETNIMGCIRFYNGCGLVRGDSETTTATATTSTSIQIEWERDVEREIEGER